MPVSSASFIARFIVSFLVASLPILPVAAQTNLPVSVNASVTPPREFLGFTPGDDYKLANYKQSYAYFHKIAAQTKRMRLWDAGKTAMGEPMMVAAISSEENLTRLDRFKQIAHALADGRVSEQEARVLAKEGRVIVWVDGGMHATEVGCAQHTINLGYDLVTREDEEFQRIRERTIVLLVPSINPDGQNLVADWFNKNYGTPQEGTPLPVLYQKYSGHDNNRDWYMLNLPETRNMTRLLYHDWFPQIVYNHHQAGGMFPERMFIPPYDEPLNPNIPPLVIRGINAVGTAMHTRFEEEEKSGVISLDTYSAWWNGGMRTAPFFHNIIGILTEVAHPSPYPTAYKVSAEKQEPTTWYPSPYRGGQWHFADTVAYMNTGSMGLLNWAADNGEKVQLDRWRMARTAVRLGETEAPYGFIVPLDAAMQHDPNTAALFLERMRLGGLEIRFAQKPFTQGTRTYPAGTAVLLSAQPNRPFLLDMVQPQKHPVRRQGPDGPVIPPYDIAGWTLTLQMGVNTVPMSAKPTEETLGSLSLPVTTDIGVPMPTTITKAPNGGAYLFPAERNASFSLANRLLAAGITVNRWTTARTIGKTRWAAGTFAVPANADTHKRIAALASELYLPIAAVPNAAGGAESLRLRPVRLGTYDPFGGNISQGWMQLVLEMFAFSPTTITNPDLRTGSLNNRLDALILTTYPNVKNRAVGTPVSRENAEKYGGLGQGFLGGPAPKSVAPEVKARLDGIGSEGEENLRRFVEDGGTLIAVDAAVAPVVELFRLPIRDVTKETKFYSPGSVLRVEIDPNEPLCWGMSRDLNIFFDRGAAWDSTLSFPTVSRGGAFALYPDENPLLSGWIVEDQIIRRRAAGVTYMVGKGKIVVYGFDVTFRGQSHMGFPLLFNALYPTVPSDAVKK